MDVVKFRKIKCETPVLLFDRSVIPIICQYGGYYVDGIFHHVSYRADRYFQYSNFSPYRLGLYRSPKDKDGYFLDLDRASRFYTYDVDDKIVPLFILVPCSKCSVCRYQKKQSLISRLQCESSSYPFPPLFVTLTYQKKFLPAEGVSRTDVVLFLKRLKYFLAKNHFNEHFTYYLNAEYGHNNIYRKSNGSLARGTSRPHYHCIFFGISCSRSDLKRLEGIFQSAWSSDLRSSSSLPRLFVSGKFIDSRSLGNVDLQFIRSSSAGVKYAAKYLSKKNCVPDSKNPLFTSCSRRPAIGLRFLDRDRLNFFRSHPEFHDYRIRNFDGSLFKFRFTPYYIRKIYPSYNQIFDSKFRNSLYKIESLCQELSSLNYFDDSIPIFLYMLNRYLLKERMSYVRVNCPSPKPWRLPFCDDFLYSDILINDILTEVRSLAGYPLFSFGDELQKIRTLFLDSLPEIDFDINLLSCSCRDELRADQNERLEEIY